MTLSEHVVAMQLTPSSDQSRELNQAFILAAVAVIIAAQKQESTR
jgi:hypothetical protein